MAKMTKTQIQERQCAIWEEMDKLEKQSREANGGDIKFTDEEAAKYDALVRESAGLSARAKAMASDAELEHMRSNEDKAVKLREMLKQCVQKRENATTILNNAAAGNTTGNMEAGGLIPLHINEIIDTKVEGLELPADLKMQTGVVGNEIWPFSTDDVNFTINGEVQKVSEQKLNFANIQATLQRIAASVAVSHRAIDNAAPVFSSTEPIIAPKIITSPMPVKMLENPLLITSGIDFSGKPSTTARSSAVAMMAMKG